MKNRVDSITQAVTYPLPFLHNNSSILWRPIKSAQSNQIYEKIANWEKETFRRQVLPADEGVAGGVRVQTLALKTMWRQR